MSPCWQVQGGPYTLPKRTLTCWFSSSARAVTALAPRIVPRIVCGRRNFQNAARKAPARCESDSCSRLPPPCSSGQGRTAIYAVRASSQETLGPSSYAVPAHSLFMIHAKLPEALCMQKHGM